jgi:lysophospholipase L1-like esterase
MISVVRSIGLWGDSVLKGVVQNGQTKKYSILHDTGIGEAAHRLGISMINRSHFGYTVSHGKRALGLDLTRGVNCEAAILAYGGNDCDYDWQAVALAPTELHLPNTPIEQFVRELSELVEMLRKRAIRPILMSLPPLVPERYFRHISQAGSDTAAVLEAWLGDIGYLYRWHEMYSNAIVQLAGSVGAALMDVRTAFLRQRNYQRLLCEDGIHPNPQGQSLIGQVFAEMVARWESHATSIE